MPWKKIFILMPRLVAALILLQTLMFKFGIGGQEYLIESQELFSNLMFALTGSTEFESVVRISTGIAELVTAILLLIPVSAWAGAILGIGLMTGAMLSHFLFIGISINGDGGQLLCLAIAVLTCCLKVLYDERHKMAWLTTSQ